MKNTGLITEIGNSMTEDMDIGINIDNDNSEELGKLIL